MIDRIVNNAVSRKTGARGLALELTEYIEQQAFESFGNNKDAVAGPTDTAPKEQIKLPAFNEVEFDDEQPDNDIPF